MVGSRKKPTSSGYPSIEEIQGNPLPERGKDKGERYLSLDISTTCVGWCLGVDKKVARWGKLVFKTTAEAGETLVAFEEFFCVLLATYEPSRCLIENVVSRRGTTTKRHAEMHGIVKKCWREVTGKEIKKSWLIGAKSVKQWMAVPRGANHAENKMLMVNEINTRLPHLGLKFHANSAYISDDDIADAIAVLLTYWARNSKSHIPRKRKEK